MFLVHRHRCHEVFDPFRQLLNPSPLFFGRGGARLLHCHVLASDGHLAIGQFINHNNKTLHFLPLVCQALFNTGLIKQVETTVPTWCVFIASAPATVPADSTAPSPSPDPRT